MALGDLLDQGQAEADPAGLLSMRRQTEERLENALAHRLRDAGAAVRHLHRHSAAGVAAGDRNADLDLVPAVALAVLEQVAHGAPEQPLARR
jgi:hypothetical protein